MSYNQSLSSNSNYPPMSQVDWDNAPFNQPDSEQELIDAEVCVSTSLSKNTIVQVDDYETEEWYDADIDDEGHSYCDRGVDYNTSGCDFKKAYTEDHYTILELLELLKDYVNEEMNNPDISKQRIHTLNKILKDCDGWVEDELEVVEA